MWTPFPIASSVIIETKITSNTFTEKKWNKKCVFWCKILGIHANGGVFKMFMKILIRKKVWIAFKDFCTKINLSFNSVFPLTFWSTLVNREMVRSWPLEGKAEKHRQCRIGSLNSVYTFLHAFPLNSLHNLQESLVLLKFTSGIVKNLAEIVFFNKCG